MFVIDRNAPYFRPNLGGHWSLFRGRRINTENAWAGFGIVFIDRWSLF